MTDVATAIKQLRMISPPLAEAVKRRPELLDGTATADSVSLRVQTMLARVALADARGTASLEQTTRALSDAMDEIVGHELESALDHVSARYPVAADLAFSVIAMGKWGARELNYYSDIDLVFVYEPEPAREDESRSAGLAIASRLMSTLSEPTFDGPTLNVDADLRPEGSMGPLARSLEGYVGYYQRWGEAWELQALLKARHAAGDAGLGTRFREMADRIIWEEGLDADALRSIRTLKARAETESRSADIKRSRGGIRDIEFAVQILQLVHGRVDTQLRVTATLDAITALSSHNYIEESEAAKLSDAYRFLRNTEHRLQLRRLRQTHDLPKTQEEKEWLGRALGFDVDPATAFDNKLAEVRETARDLHERLYFRPILDSLVGLESATLDPIEAGVRLKALGFRNLGAATRAFTDLMAGVTRRSAVMHQILPLMLDWLSQSPDPDLGLAQLRLLLSKSTDHAVLVRLLQTNPVAGERLCTLLGTGKLVGDLMDRIPEFVPRLADDDLISSIRGAAEATASLIGIIDSRPERDARVGTIRRFVRRRKLRIAARDILGVTQTQATIRSLSDSADAAMAGALHMLMAPGDSFAVIAVGRWGGHELSYGSDIDVMYVHDGENARGLHLAGQVGQILSEPNRHGDAYQIDADLRPEGKNGPLSRSLASYRRYYEEWVQPWELLALVKARPAGGTNGLADAYFETIEPIVWRPTLPREVVTAIRAMKARVESERIPAGEDPDFHLKLGPGGLSDVEFVTQLLQLKHGGLLPELRSTGTLDALDALQRAEIVDRTDHQALRDAYSFCTRVRLRLHLQSGHPSDSLPVDPGAASRLAVSLGFDRTGELREEYRRHTRRARRSFESLFYD